MQSGGNGESEQQFIKGVAELSHHPARSGFVKGLACAIVRPPQETRAFAVLSSTGCPIPRSNDGRGTRLPASGTVTSKRTRASKDRDPERCKRGLVMTQR